MTIKELNMDPEAFASCLILATLDKYGTDALGWEPETLRKQFELDGCPLHEDNADKIMAVISLLNSDLFHVSLEGFNMVCRSLSGEGVDAEWFVPATVDQVAWGVLEARMIEGPEEFDAQGFSKDIELFTGMILADEGFSKAPSMLAFAIFDSAWEGRRAEALGGDPDMASAFEGRQNTEMDELEEEMTGRMRGLASQLKALELKDGDAKGPAEQILKTLGV